MKFNYNNIFEKGNFDFETNINGLEAVSGLILYQDEEGTRDITGGVTIYNDDLTIYAIYDFSNKYTDIENYLAGL